MARFNIIHIFLSPQTEENNSHCSRFSCTSSVYKLVAPTNVRRILDERTTPSVGVTATVNLGG